MRLLWASFLLRMPRSFRLVLFMGLPTFFRGSVPLYCAVFLYEFGRCPFCCKAALCVSFASSFCPITPPCGFYPCFYFILLVAAKEIQSAAFQQKGHLPNSYRNTAQKQRHSPTKESGQPHEEHETKRARHPKEERGPERPQTSPGGSTAAARWERPPGE